MPPGIWVGLADVAEAVRRVLEPDPRFAEVCAGGAQPGPAHGRDRLSGAMDAGLLRP